jgi:hypothetical protein
VSRVNIKLVPFAPYGMDVRFGRNLANFFSEATNGYTEKIRFGVKVDFPYFSGYPLL